MADIRASIMKAVLEADRLHQEFGTEAKGDLGESRVDVFGMFVRRDIPLMFQPLEGLLGAFIDDPSLGVIVTTQRPLPVQRFTAAHELGHALLGHKPSLDNDEIIARAPFPDRKSYDIQEIQANAFASELLMPKWLFAKQMTRQGWSAKDLARPEIPYQLALRLGTSYVATCHALFRHKALRRATYEDLLRRQPRAIKQDLTAPYEPENWYGDVWLITERDDGILLQGSRSDLVVLKLTEHSGSGYTWIVDDLAAAGLKVVQDNRAADPDSDFVGGEVSRTVIAEAQNGAEGSITLREVRPWDLTEQPLRAVGLQIDLSGPVGRGLVPAQRKLLIGAA